MSIVIAIIIFSLIIIFHELGHFLLAKKNGICVEEFSIGLGPRLIGKKIGETVYCIKLLPFGGACVMTGEDEASDDERAFGNKSVWARMAVVFAGPFFNFILAFVLAAVLIGVVGYDEPVVTSVTEGSPAEEAGIQAGDRIIRLNNMHIHVYREISNYLTLHPDKAKEAVTVVYERDGEKYTTSLTPEYNEEAGRYLMGLQWDYSRTKGNIFSVIGYDAYEVKYWICITVDSLRLMVTGSVSANDISGPVGIISTIGSTYTESRAISLLAVFANLINISILLTANLGVMNLLPLPALDGGRLVFLIIEAIRGKRIDPDKEGMVHFVGLVLLLGLMVIIMFNDIHKLFV